MVFTVYSPVVQQSYIMSKISVSQTIAEIVTCFLSFILCSPILVSCVCIVVIVRLILKLYFLWFTKGKYLLMSAEDSVWAYSRPGSYTVITGFEVLEGICDLEKIRNRFSNRFNGRGELSRKMRRRITSVFGFYCWEDCSETFDINKIIKYIDGDEQCSLNETEVFERIGMFCDEPINPGKDQPQWEVIVIPNYIYNDPRKHGKRYYAMIKRVNHSYLDGISLVHTFHDVTGDHFVESAIDPYKPLKIPMFKKVYAYLILFILGPYSFYKFYCLKENTFFDVDHVVGPKTVGWTNPLRLDAVKKIKSTKGISVTAIFNCALGSSLKKLALQNKFRYGLLDKITGVNTGAKFPYRYLAPQNKFSLFMFPINMTIDNVQDRLDSVQATAKNLPNSPHFLMHYWNMRIFGLFPSFVINTLLENCNRATYALSNVPGLIEPVTMFDGDRLCDITAWAPIKLAFGLTLVSYNGLVRGGMVYDGVVSSDPKHIKTLLQYFDDEIKEMGKLAGIPENEIFLQEL